MGFVIYCVALVIVVPRQHGSERNVAVIRSWYGNKVASFTVVVPTATYGNVRFGAVLPYYGKNEGKRQFT